MAPISSSDDTFEAGEVGTTSADARQIVEEKCFFLDREKNVPTAQRFFDDLCSGSKKKGLLLVHSEKDHYPRAFAGRLCHTRNRELVEGEVRQNLEQFRISTVSLPVEPIPLVSNRKGDAVFSSLKPDLRQRSVYQGVPKSAKSMLDVLKHNIPGSEKTVVIFWLEVTAKHAEYAISALDRLRELPDQPNAFVVFIICYEGFDLSIGPENSCDNVHIGEISDFEYVDEPQFTQWFTNNLRYDSAIGDRLLDSIEIEMLEKFMERSDQPFADIRRSLIMTALKARQARNER